MTAATHVDIIVVLSLRVARKRWFGVEPQLGRYRYYRVWISPREL